MKAERHVNTIFKQESKVTQILRLFDSMQKTKNKKRKIKNH